MKYKKEILLSTIFLLTILSIFGVSAITVITPANSATISGATSVLNATNTTAGFSAMVNCTFYARSSLTANSSWTNLGTFSNNTVVSGASINGTFNSAILEDANNYEFNASCRNYSNQVASGIGTTTVIIDNTIPTAPTSLSPTSDGDGSVDFSATVIGRETTSCTLFFVSVNPGSTSYSMTHSGSTCTVTVNPMAEQGYDYYVRASDETNTTNSATEHINVDVGNSKGKLLPILNEQQNQIIQQEIVKEISSNTLSYWIIGIIFIVLIIVVLWNVFKR